VATATLTSKGQITIPQEIRDQLHLRKGQKIDFQVDERGRVILNPLTYDIRKLKGSIRSPRKKPLSLKEMERVIARGYAGLL
jgi:AbrB family looped-hinge helix DNA binding protein